MEWVIGIDWNPQPSTTSCSSGYPTNTAESNKSRARPCTEQNFALPGLPTMTGQCEKSSLLRSGINREIRYETTWDTTRAFYSRRLGRFTAPFTTAFVKVLTHLDPDALDRAARTWAAQQASRTDPVAIDGKSIRGAARHNPGAKHLLVAAAEHRSGIVLGQQAVRDKSNEVPAVRTLLTGLDLTGRVVTLDALHTCHQTARCVVEQCGAHYVMTAVKDNCPNLLADLAGLDWERPAVRATEHHTSDNGHGRIEKRSCRVLDLTEHRERARPASSPGRLAHRARAAHRQHRGKVEHETVHGLTSMPPDQATSQVVLALVRGHWSIENRLHHVRDVSYDEDRCRVRTGHLPRNLACLTNLASPSFASTGASTPSPPALRPPAPGRPYATSSTRHNAQPTLPRTLGPGLHHRACVRARPAG